MKNKLILLILLIILLWGEQAYAVDPRLQMVHSFAFALGVDLNEPENLAHLQQFSLVVVDGEEASAEQIAALRGSGAVVFGYLSVGTIEPYRSWYKQLKKYRLSYSKDWGEWVANVKSKDYRKAIIKKVLPLIMNKGFDGIFLDNIDIVEEKPKLKAGMLSLLKDIRKYTQARGQMVFTQNADSLIESIYPFIDAWNREDVSFSYDFDTEQYFQVSSSEHLLALASLQRMKELGVFTTATDYLETASEPNLSAAISAACGVGASSYVGNIMLDEIFNADMSCR